MFCAAAREDQDAGNRILERASYNFVMLNKYPYTTGHLMVIPLEHQSNLSALSPKARAEMMELVEKWCRLLIAEYAPQGFNLGVNMGSAAGAGIAEHLHFHVVPRWNGDVNFMTVLGDTRVLPESLEDTYSKLTDALIRA